MIVIKFGAEMMSVLRMNYNNFGGPFTLSSRKAIKLSLLSLSILWLNDVKVQSVILIQYTILANSVNISSRSDICSFCVCVGKKSGVHTQPWHTTLFCLCLYTGQGKGHGCMKRKAGHFYHAYKYI